ncbi:hypothetical protein SAMN05216188_104209 [Lentzea xinjiangensis]|uniref:Uncharacterized protein n=1 Tax=Lentzea xinjiangensis TaxID=402600 RepID=A0A1H9HUJ5_9PSEU|nr:hypothetical protein [Lentzea xinjiangensis]SEQ66029.1 hypothetical protein SAMN05216188_104209 [Lentzea xinjiangensis]
MFPTATLERLTPASATADDSDDMKIYQFDREASMDWFTGIIWTTCSPGTYRATDEVLAA